MAETGGSGARPLVQAADPRLDSRPPVDRLPLTQDLVERLVVLVVRVHGVLHERKRDHICDAELAEQVVAAVEQRLEQVERRRDARPVLRRIPTRGDQVRSALPEPDRRGWGSYEVRA